jgi:hypothetical protein
MIHGRSDAFVTVPLKVGVRVFPHERGTVPRTEHTTIVPVQVRHFVRTREVCEIVMTRSLHVFFWLSSSRCQTL